MKALIIEWAAFIASLVFAAYYFIANGFGGWDAQEIWNLHAKILLAGDIQKLWSLTNSHPDYPLLLPAIIADVWRIFGRGDWVPRAVAVAFALGTGIVLSFESRIAAAILLFTPIFLRVATWETADVPLGFFFLCTLVALKHEKFLLAGVLCGLAAWTKNEGLLFSIITASVVLWRHPRKAPEMLASLLPFIAFLAWFKHIAPANDTIGPNTSLYAIAQWSRYWIIIKSLCRELVRDFWLPVIALLALRRRPSPVASLIVAGMALGYFGVYVVTPLSLQWHLDTSLNRLLVQLLPSALLVYTDAVKRSSQPAGGRVEDDSCDDSRGLLANALQE
jgi:hypothetical protein